MKRNTRLLALCGVSMLAGCFSLETTPLGASSERAMQLQSTHGKATEHVVVSNFGWYFFNRWPIVCGNARIDRRSPWVFFRNDVDEHLLQSRLMRYAAARECDVTDLNLFNNAEVLMSIGVGGVSLPLPYVISYRELQYSCSLVEKGVAGASGRSAGKRDMNRLNEEMRRLLDAIPDGGGE